MFIVPTHIYNVIESIAYSWSYNNNKRKLLKKILDILYFSHTALNLNNSKIPAPNFYYVTLKNK